MEQFSRLQFRSICLRNDLRISEGQLDTFEKFLSLLLQENRHTNLISRQDENNLWVSHFLHSISPAFLLAFSKTAEVLDLGSGGGLPGIPLKILFPSMNVTLLDSVEKKIDALERIVTSLGLEGLRTIRARAEDLPESASTRKAFDVVIARAVATLKKLAQWSEPLLKPSMGDITVLKGEKTVVPPGTLIAFKGGDLRREIDEMRRSRDVKSIHEFPLEIGRAHV